MPYRYPPEFRRRVLDSILTQLVAKTAPSLVELFGVGPTQKAIALTALTGNRVPANGCADQGFGWAFGEFVYDGDDGSLLACCGGARS